MLAIPTRVHGVIDYVFAVVLLTLPLVAGIGLGTAGAWVPIILGLVLLGYTVITDQELSLKRQIDPKLHLWLDAGVGILLAISPWLFGFDRDIWLPHLVLGILFLAVAILSETIPSYERRQNERRSRPREG
jgi:hypothetical protein